MQTLETPLKVQVMQLMRLAGYINAVPELRWDFQYQDTPDEVYVDVDSDWAQCCVLAQALAGQLLSATAHDIAQQR